MANRWGNSGNSERLYFRGLKNHNRWWLQPPSEKAIIGFGIPDLIRWVLVVWDKSQRKAWYCCSRRSRLACLTYLLSGPPEGGLQILGEDPGLQPASKWRPQSYHHKELNSANNEWTWKRTLRLRWYSSSGWLLDFSLIRLEQMTQCSVPGLLTHGHEK